jgi:putative mRNA 3-end processing factor
LTNLIVEEFLSRKQTLFLKFATEAQFKLVTVNVFGGGREVGRSGFEVKGTDTKLLLDYGVLIKEERPLSPLSTSPKDLNGIIITHAHLDHSGMAPMFYVSGTPPVYMTNMTRQLTDLLIRDFLHLSAYYIPFEALELRTMIENCTEIGENGARIGRADLEFQRSGHLPGSINVLVTLDGRRIWYSGDINTIDTALLKRARISPPELDMAIIESTYATVDHAPRDECERRLIEILNEVVEGGGLALIPAFSVGRSQEMLCVLQKHGFRYDVVLDGMGRTATRMIASRPEELRDPDLLKRAMSRVKWVAGDKDRKKIVNKPGVVISSSGMLTGGASIYYMDRIRNRSKDCVILVSFQVPGTPGRTLLDEGRYGPPGELKKVKCRTKWINFSSHCGRTNLMEIVRSLKGNPKILCVHGEAASCIDFAERIKEETGHDAYAPAMGSTFSV